MELSEATDLLKEMKESAMYLRLYHDKKAQLKVEAIDTILKALDNRYYEMVMKEQDDIINDLKARLDNSISKDEVRKKIDEIANQTWYVADGEEAKRACMDELEDLIN